MPESEASTLTQFPEASDVVYWSEAALAKEPRLARVPLATHEQVMSGQTIPDIRLFALYENGWLLHAWDMETHETFKPTNREAEMLAAMSPGEFAHYFADKANFSPVSKVYFLGHRGHAIKIGMTVDLAGRFATIQSCSPIALEIFATRPGGQQREAAYHTQFAEHRLHGEWFAPHPDILAEIERLSA